MTKYIETWQGIIAVESDTMAKEQGKAYIMALDVLRGAGFDPEPGVWKKILVPDEDVFMEQLKEQYGEDSTSGGPLLPGFGRPRL